MSVDRLSNNCHPKPTDIDQNSHTAVWFIATNLLYNAAQNNKNLRPDSNVAFHMCRIELLFWWTERFKYAISFKYQISWFQIKENDKSNIQYQLSTEYSFYFFCFLHIDGSAGLTNLKELSKQDRGLHWPISGDINVSCLFSYYS